MIRAFDLDGVMCRFDKAYAAILTEQTGLTFDVDSPEFPATWFWEREAGVTKAQEKAAWAVILNSDFWETLEPYPNAAAALTLIRECRTHGDSIYFITSRPGNYAKHLTEWWLDQHGYECPTVLIANAKGPVCRGLEVDMFVDDKPQNCWEVSAACPKANVFLLDAPYNRQLDATWSDANNITRVMSILDPRLYASEVTRALAA